MRHRWERIGMAAAGWGRRSAWTVALMALLWAPKTVASAPEATVAPAPDGGASTDGAVARPAAGPVLTRTAAPAAPAPTAAGPVLTRAAALAAAAEHNAGLGALAHQVDATKDDATARYRQHFGTLDAIASYSFLNDDQVLRPMSRQLMAGGLGGLPFDRNQFHYGLRYRVPLYLGGKLYAAVDIARLEAHKAAVRLAGSRWTVRYNVVALYGAAQSLDAARRALDDQIAALGRTRDRLALLVREDKRPDIDRLKVVESLEQAKARRADVVGKRRRAIALMQALTGRSLGEDAAPALSSGGAIRLEAISETLPELRISQEELRDILENTTPIREARIAEEQASRAVRVATSAFIPSVAASAQWLQHAGPSAGGPLNTWALGVQVDIPVFEGGSRFAALDAAKARRAAAAEALRNARLQAQAHLDEALAAFTAVRKQVAAAEARQDAARGAARIEQIRYDTGAGTIEDLVLARARAEGADAGLAQTRASVVTAAEQVNRTVEQEVVR